MLDLTFFKTFLQGSSSHVNDNAPINKSGQENGTKMKNACVSINLVGGDFKAETKKEKIGDKGWFKLCFYIT